MASSEGLLCVAITSSKSFLHMKCYGLGIRMSIAWFQHFFIAHLMKFSHTEDSFVAKKELCLHTSGLLHMAIDVIIVQNSEHCFEKLWLYYLVFGMHG